MDSTAQHSTAMHAFFALCLLTACAILGGHASIVPVRKCLILLHTLECGRIAVVPSVARGRARATDRGVDTTLRPTLTVEGLLRWPG
jgi:hypothetical protein